MRFGRTRRDSGVQDQSRVGAVEGDRGIAGCGAQCGRRRQVISDRETAAGRLAKEIGDGYFRLYEG